jgi:hypothetical protein
MSKIALTHEDKEYVLEFDRNSVRQMEAQGFVLDEFTSKPMMMVPMLFTGAFFKNCKGTKRRTIDVIYENLIDKTGLIEALMEMYAETLSTLTDESEEGNVSWAIVK